MHVKHIKIPIYGVNITYIEVEDGDKAKEVIQEFPDMNISKEDLEEVCININDRCNGGDTFTCLEEGQILVIIYQSTNEQFRRNSINHEKRHVEDRILSYLHIDDLEASAYLAGYLSEFIY